MINALKKMVPERLSLRERAFQRHSDDLFISCKGNLLETFDEVTGVRTLVERDDLKVPTNYHDYDIDVLLKTNPQLLQPNQALLQRNCMSMYDRLAYEIDSFEAYQASLEALRQRDSDLEQQMKDATPSSTPSSTPIPAPESSPVKS